MTYELVKKLKDAGFPYDKICGFCFQDLPEPESYQPTLSELIAACGEKFSQLEQMNGPAEDYDWVKEEGTWHAEYQIGISTQVCASGHTPEEAVANLWLKLNDPS